MILRKWIVNRQYLLIHCLILCNLKVKNLCEQLIRLVSDNNELQAIFVKVDAAIVREYVEYLATKDKFKFRLALFEAECQHYQYLLYE